MVAGGDAIARDADGRVVFVEGALPGEHVRAEVLSTRKSHAMARVIDVVDAGAHAPDHYLLDALDQLAPKRRAAVVLRYYLDLPEAEIGAILNMRPGTVKSSLHRALARLHTEVDR